MQATEGVVRPAKGRSGVEGWDAPPRADQPVQALAVQAFPTAPRGGDQRCRHMHPAGFCCPPDPCAPHRKSKSSMRCTGSCFLRAGRGWDDQV